MGFSMWPFYSAEDFQEEDRRREAEALPGKVRELEGRLEAASKVEKCASQRHEPYLQKVIDAYRPGKLGVTVSCSNCNHIYERTPTPEEIKDYKA